VVDALPPCLSPRLSALGKGIKEVNAPGSFVAQGLSPWHLICTVGFHGRGERGD
jgi:hypothetical protein